MFGGQRADHRGLNGGPQNDGPMSKSLESMKITLYGERVNIILEKHLHTWN